MRWAKPAYPKAQVDAAGRALIADETDVFAYSGALDILNNWRSSHSFPLNTFQVYLRDKARSVGPSAVVAQRLKRTTSIIQKLARFGNMQLSRMQDIGGCRAVLESVAHAEELRQVYRRSRFKHALVREYDYIESPKASGYRSLHLVYRYHSDRRDTYNGLHVEIQIRSRLQHAWATAVETVGAFLDQSLKSSEGPADWLRFFALTGSAFALVEKGAPVPDTPSSKTALVPAIHKLRDRLEVQKTLATYGHALRVVGLPDLRGAKYYLLDLRLQDESLAIRSYRASQLGAATADYLATEKRIRNVSGAQAVLVAAESLDALRRSYPNYFMDTEVFMLSLEEFLGS